MADARIVKTSDINKVPIKVNQVIFCSDGSIYYDYSNTLRVRNPVSATHLPDFKVGTAYKKDDAVVYKDSLYRALSDFTAKCFNPDNWQLLSSNAEAHWPIKASDVFYDSENTELPAENLQQAIDLLDANIKEVENADFVIGDIL